MSYDVELVIGTGAGCTVIVQDCGNYTYNCAAMLADAGNGLSLNDLTGVHAPLVMERLIPAILALQSNPGRYQAMNPENGWGNYESWVGYLENIVLQCRRHPSCTLRVT